MENDLGTPMNWLRQTRYWTCHGIFFNNNIILKKE